MKLFLQNNPDNNARFLSETASFGAGSIFSSQAGTDTDYIFDRRDQTIIIDGNTKIYLNFTVTGNVSVTPKLLVKESVLVDGSYIIQDRVISPGTLSSQTSGTDEISVMLTWEFNLAVVESLENKDLILRLNVRDLQDDGSPSVITLSNQSSLDANIGEGEEQSINLFSIQKFSVFQKTERIFLWTETDAKQEISIPMYSKIHNRETVHMEIYSEINAFEEVSQGYNVTARSHEEFDPLLPHIKNLKIGGYYLPDWEVERKQWFRLRKEENLESLIQEMERLPEIIVPPAIPKIPEIEGSLENVANKMVETLEMLKSQPTRTVPGDFFKTFLPGPLYGGTMILRNEEWQLPLGFTSQKYSLILSLEPKVSKSGTPATIIDVSQGSSLWMTIRFKPTGANITAEFKDQPGMLVLNKDITSRERVMSWVWFNPTAPFDVNLIVSNNVLNRPGFAGTSAALMLA